MWSEAYREDINAPSPSYANNADAPFYLVHFATHTVSGIPPAQQHPYLYLGIYAAISLAAGFVSVSGLVMQLVASLRGSRILFDKLVKAVVGATMRWHDTTPQGRMLNRFSKVRSRWNVFTVKLTTR